MRFKDFVKKKWNRDQVCLILKVVELTNLTAQGGSDTDMPRSSTRNIKSQKQIGKIRVWIICLMMTRDELQPESNQRLLNMLVGKEGTSAVAQEAVGQWWLFTRIISPFITRLGTLLHGTRSSQKLVFFFYIHSRTHSSTNNALKASS